jgi:hypothetical protein
MGVYFTQLTQSPVFSHIQHNFKISPKGPIWNKICELFSVDKSKCVSAISIYNESTNPENTWDGHYEYAVYRPDDAWRGKALNKFEIQPIIDVNKLPEHHYLPFEKAEEFVNYFRDIVLNTMISTVNFQKLFKFLF